MPDVAACLRVVGQASADCAYCHRDAITDLVVADVRGTPCLFSASRDGTCGVVLLCGIRVGVVASRAQHVSHVCGGAATTVRTQARFGCTRAALLALQQCQSSEATSAPSHVCCGCRWVKRTAGECATGARIEPLRAASHVCHCAHRLYSGSEDQTVNVWHPAKPGGPLFTIQDAHDKAVTVRRSPVVAVRVPRMPVRCAVLTSMFPLIPGRAWQHSRFWPGRHRSPTYSPPAWTAGSWYVPPVSACTGTASCLLTRSGLLDSQMHSLATPDKPQGIPQHTVQLGGGIVTSQFVAYPSANKNVLVLGLTV